MIKVKTQNLTKLALDYAVALTDFERCETPTIRTFNGYAPTDTDPLAVWVRSEVGAFMGMSALKIYNPSENWSLAGPLLEKNQVVWRHQLKVVEARVMSGEIGLNRKASDAYVGNCYIQAGLRAIVGAIYGREINLPLELEQWAK